MSQDLFLVADWTHLLQYWAGNVTTTQATKKYAGTNISVGLAVGDEVFIAGCAQSASNGIKTIATIAGVDEFTVTEVIGVGEGPTAITINEQSRTPWTKVPWYSKIVGILSTSQNANLYIEWSTDGSTTRVTDTTAIVAGTAAKFSVAIVAPWIRATLRNDGTDQTAVNTILYAQEI